MSAVQAIRNRLGLGLSLKNAAQEAASLSTIGSSVVAKVLTGRSIVQGNSIPRAQSLFMRHFATQKEVTSVLEIGHRGISHVDWVPGTVRHDQRDVTVDGMTVDLVAALRDLRCGSYDAIYSVDVFEQIRMPWRVADEITRLLRPGGLTFHTTVFTTRYKPSPEDFFRFTPDGLKSLFSDLECVTAEFDATEQPSESRSVKRCPGDIFGGSREGWRVHFAGRKAALR